MLIRKKFFKSIFWDFSQYKSLPSSLERKPDITNMALVQMNDYFISCRCQNANDIIENAVGRFIFQQAQPLLSICCHMMWQEMCMKQKRVVIFSTNYQSTQNFYWWCSPEAHQYHLLHNVHQLLKYNCLRKACSWNWQQHIPYCLEERRQKNEKTSLSKLTIKTRNSGKHDEFHKLNNKKPIELINALLRAPFWLSQSFS